MRSFERSATDRESWRPFEAVARQMSEETKLGDWVLVWFAIALIAVLCLSAVSTLF